MSFKPIEPKRDEFRKYLERSGIIEALAKVFTKLVDEEKRPENPLNYIRDNLGDAHLQADNIAQLQSELAEAKEEIVKLRRIIQQQGSCSEVEESIECEREETADTENDSSSDKNVEQNDQVQIQEENSETQ